MQHKKQPSVQSESRTDEDYKNENNTAGKSDMAASEVQKADISRRELLWSAGGVAAVLGIGAVTKALGGETVLRPPGGQDEERLLALCLRCQKCTEACPRHAIIPIGIESGFVSMRTPTMDYHVGDCDYCDKENGGVPLCVEACPTQALHLGDGATRQNTVIGEPLLIKNWCLAYRLTHCRDCYDACQLDAIRLDEANRPHIEWDKCNGCGECEHACRSMTAGTPVPGATHRAIIVVPLGQGGEV